MSDLFSVMETIRAKGANVIFLKEQIDTTTNTGTLVFNLMAVINNYQRELINDSCREGREAAEKKEGFDRWGRPDKIKKEKKQLVRDLKKQGKSYNDIVKLTGISRASVYLILKPEKRSQFNENLKEARNQKKSEETLKIKKKNHRPQTLRGEVKKRRRWQTRMNQLQLTPCAE